MSWKEEVNNWVEKKKLTIELKRRSWQLSWKEEVDNWVEKKKLTIELKKLQNEKKEASKVAPKYIVIFDAKIFEMEEALRKY